MKFWAISSPALELRPFLSWDLEAVTCLHRGVCKAIEISGHNISSTPVVTQIPKLGIDLEQLKPHIQFWSYIYRLPSNSFVIHNRETLKVEKLVSLVYPKSDATRSTIFYNSLVTHIAYFHHKTVFPRRLQRGLGSFVSKGIERFNQYAPELVYLCQQFGVPSDLLTLTMVESLFTPWARSKANALGLWQIMPNIAKNLFGKKYARKASLDIFLASLGALHILRDSKRMLGRWDLSIISYNLGLRGTRKLRHIKRVKTSELMKRIEDPNFGFAAKNFLLSFMAMKSMLGDLPKAKAIYLYKGRKGLYWSNTFKRSPMRVDSLKYTGRFPKYFL